MEQEFDVVVEVEGLDVTLITQDITYSIIGLETETPIMRLGNEFYQGTYEDTMGTSLIFQSPNGSNPAPSDSTTQPGAVISSTRKKLKFKKVVLKKK